MEVIKKMPAKGSPQAGEFKHLWHSSDHKGKVALCNLLDVSYDRAQHVVATWQDLPIEEVTISPDITWTEQIEIFKSMDRLIALHEETPTEVIIPIETELPVCIVYFADWQLGQFGVDYDSFRRDVSIVKAEKGLFCEVGGDGYQNIIQPSKIGSSHNQIPIAPQAVAPIISSTAY